MQILFRTVLYMARTAGSYNQLRALLRLQVLNGVTYELRYGRKYVPVVLKFLAAVARKYLRKLWVTSTFRAIMTDEVKVADSQWLSTAARLYLGDQCITVKLAGALCAVPLSQSSCEQLNSTIKLVHGDGRHCLKATVAEDEIVVRTTTMPEEELVHSAIREWATATHRRTACIKVNTSTPDMADSSSEGFSTSDDSTTDTASSVSGTSSSESELDGESSSGSSTTPSVSAPDAVAHAEPAAQCAPKAEGTPKVDAQVVHHCPVFKQMMEENEVLRSYAVRHRGEGREEGRERRRTSSMA